MSFWTNPWKATKSFINKYIPGGKYLTGDDLSRHKRNYNESRDRYENCTSEVTNTINNLSREIQQSMQGLRSLEDQQYQYSNRSYEMESQLNQYASQYDSGLKHIEAQRARLSSSAEQLKQSFERLKQKAPALEARMREVEQLPGVFQNLYDRVAQQKDSLRGLTEEAGSTIAKHQQDVESLKNQRQAIEEKIRHSMNDITREHKNISSEKAELERQLGNYQASQDRLLRDTSNFDQARHQLTSIIEQYKQHKNIEEQIATDYASRKSHVEELQNKLRSYSESAQKDIDYHTHDLEWRAGKYQTSASNTGLVQGIGLSLATYGLGAGISSILGGGSSIFSSIAGGIGSGLQSLSPFVGIGHYMNKSNIVNKLGNFEKINLANKHQYDGMSGNLEQMARYGRSGLEKMPIAELGGLKQAVEHFNMRSVPRLNDLPQLSESLGKVVSLKDIEGLTLGLPSMTAASGKQYNYEVLYDNDFIKKLKKVSKKLGEPYLNPNSTINSNSTRNMVTAYG